MLYSDERDKHYCTFIILNFGFVILLEQIAGELFDIIGDADFEKIQKILQVFFH